MSEEVQIKELIIIYCHGYRMFLHIYFKMFVS